MNRKMRIRTMTTLAAAGVLAAGFSLPAQAQETATVAALYNLTGGMSSIDAPAFNGAILHAEQINQAGGLLGGQVMLEVVGIDTKTDQQETATAAQQSVAMDNIVAGIGYGDTTFVLAAAPTFQDAGIPFVTSGATHPMLPTWVGDYMFMTAFGDDDQSFAIADYAYDTLGLRRVAVWTDDSMDFTRALTQFFTERFVERGGEIVGDDFFMMGDTDFSAQIARLQAIDPVPDGVFVSAIPGEAGLSVRQIREAGISYPIVSGDGFDTELVATVPGPELANDVFFSTHTYRADDRAVVTDFVAAYEARFGRPPENAFAPLGYDALGLVAQAIEAAGSTDTAAIRDALAATRGYDGVTGVISYSRESGVPPKPVAIIEVQGAAFELIDTWYPAGRAE